MNIRYFFTYKLLGEIFYKTQFWCIFGTNNYSTLTYFKIKLSLCTASLSELVCATNFYVFSSARTSIMVPQKCQYWEKRAPFPKINLQNLELVLNKLGRSSPHMTMTGRRCFPIFGSHGGNRHVYTGFWVGRG